MKSKKKQRVTALKLSLRFNKYLSATSHCLPTYHKLFLADSAACVKLPLSASGVHVKKKTQCMIYSSAENLTELWNKEHALYA